MDIVVWLRSPGLGKYEAAFRENEIDETVLPSLHETLKELGVISVGHRLKLLDAVAALRRHTFVRDNSSSAEILAELQQEVAELGMDLVAVADHVVAQVRSWAIHYPDHRSPLKFIGQGIGPGACDGGSTSQCQ